MLDARIMAAHGGQPVEAQPQQWAPNTLSDFTGAWVFPTALAMVAAYMDQSAHDRAAGERTKMTGRLA